MNDISLTQIFFVLTGIAVIIVTLLLVIGLIYLILFLKTIKEVARTAQRATEIVSEDLSDLRQSIKEKGISVGAITSFAKNISRKRVLNKKK